MVKRILSLIVVTTLVTTLLSGVVFAEVTSSIYTKLQIEALMREQLNIPEEMELMYSNLNTQDARQKQLWNMEFQKEQNYISITAEADTGEIVRFHQWNHEAYDGVISLLPEEAKAKAIAFIEDLQPERFKETEEVTVEAPSMVLHHLHRNHQEGNDYYFMFVRKLENEFFPNNYFSIQVSGVSGDIVNYDMNWDEAIYEGNKSLISTEQARNTFEEENRFELRYVQLPKDNQGEIERPVLTPVYIYVPKESDVISAVDGRLLKEEEIYNSYSNLLPRGGAVGESMAKDSVGLENYGRIEMVPEEGAMSKEAAEALVQEILSKEFDLEGMRLQNSNYSNQYDGIKGKFWSFYWQNDSHDNSLHAVLNTEGENVVSVSYNAPFRPMLYRDDAGDGGERIEKRQDGPKEIDKAEANDAIVKKIQRIFPAIDAKEIELEIRSDEKTSLLDIRTERYITDIPYNRNYINMSYDIAEDEIVQFHYNWHDVEAKASRNLMSRGAIEKKFYDAVGFEKYLLQLRDQEAREEERLDIPLRKLHPVYSLKDFGFRYIDAKDGSFLNHNGEIYEERTYQRRGFKDIENHPYRNEIILMEKMGILQEEEEAFYPDETLLRQDALKWIVEMGQKARIYPITRYNNEDGNEAYFEDIAKDHPYYEYIKIAIENNIIDSSKEYFEPLRPIEKIEMTRWILNAMEQRELAQYTEIFQVPYEDVEEINQADIGYVALSRYYNLFDDREVSDTFGGDQQFTRGGFVNILYHLLKNK